MNDPWVIAASCLAGLIVGFVSGVTRERAAGHVTSGVTGFLAGAVAVGFAGTGRTNTVATAKLFLSYLSCLFLMYIAGNVIRRHGWADWFLGPPRKKRTR